MNGDDWLKTKTRGDLRFFTACAVSSLIDSAFLVIWVLVQWLVNWLLVQLEMSGIDKVALAVFQIIFFISTLAPIIIYICMDIWIMILQAKARIRREASQYASKEHSEEDGPTDEDVEDA